jgi:hypothetical protein
MAEEIKFTEEELAQLEGKDVEDDSPAALPESEESVVEASEETVQEVKEVPAEAEIDYKLEYEKMEKANAGLLNDLVKTRKSSKEDKEWRRAIEERMELLAGQGKEEEAPVEPPDRDEDPLGWLEYQQNLVIEEKMRPVAELQQKEKEQEEYGEMLAEAGRMATEAEQDLIKSGVISEEDYYKNLDEVRYARANWYLASGVSAEEASRIIQEEERQFVFGALASGDNPAAELMKIHANLKPGPVPGREAPAVEAKPKLDKVQAVKAGSHQQGLQNVDTSGSKTSITAEDFAQLSEDDPIWQKVMGNEKLFARLNIYGEVNI